MQRSKEKNATHSMSHSKSAEAALQFQIDGGKYHYCVQIHFGYENFQLSF